MDSGKPLVGTAGWSIASRHADRFPGVGTHLQRYGRRLRAVEIDTSFYRPHRRTTYERWKASVPAGFRFSVKLPRTITHERRLVGCVDLLDRFLAEVAGLGETLGVLLVQLPPSLPFDQRAARAFLEHLRGRTNAGIACEPRHSSWFTHEPERILNEMRVARVAADPAGHDGAAEPGGWKGLAYFRLHGSPRMYYSDYPPDRLREFRRRLDEASLAGAEAWCIFDNTAEGYALANALAVDDPD